MVFRTTLAADDDIAEAYEASYLRFGERQAERYLKDLLRKFEMIARHPQLARLHMEFRPPVRVLSYAAHLIIYREETGSVLILRVVPARMDWQSLFR